jgi:hypothetical protein
LYEIAHKLGEKGIERYFLAEFDFLLRTNLKDLPDSAKWTDARHNLAKFVSNQKEFFPTLPLLKIKDVTAADVDNRIRKFLNPKFNYIPKTEDYFHTLLDDAMNDYARVFPAKKESACLANDTLQPLCFEQFDCPRFGYKSARVLAKADCSADVKLNICQNIIDTRANDVNIKDVIIACNQELDEKKPKPEPDGRT